MTRNLGKRMENEQTAAPDQKIKSLSISPLTFTILVLGNSCLLHTQRENQGQRDHPLGSPRAGMRGWGEVGCLGSVNVSGSSCHLVGAQMCLVGPIPTFSWNLFKHLSLWGVFWCPTKGSNPSPTLPWRHAHAVLCTPYISKCLPPPDWNLL